MMQNSGPGQGLDAIAYFAPVDWAPYVAAELGKVGKRYGRLFLKEGPRVPCHWAQDIWLEPRVISFARPAEAATMLRQLGTHWSGYSEILKPLLAEILALLPPLPSSRLIFPVKRLPPPTGAFTLLDDHTLLASASCLSPFPGGTVEFRENRKDPPSTAYLKLWEALTRMRKLPGVDSHCLDAGACPGGWTWVLDSLGAQVLALDRSPLDPRMMASPRVRFRSGNAFAVLPRHLADFGWERLDWLCSDLICYPDKLLAWVSQWLDSGLVDNFVITIKIQGEPDWATIAAFAAIPDSLVYHAIHNKHELTWIKPAPSAITG